MTTVVHPFFTMKSKTKTERIEETLDIVKKLLEDGEKDDMLEWRRKTLERLKEKRRRMRSARNIEHCEKEIRQVEMDIWECTDWKTEAEYDAARPSWDWETWVKKRNDDVALLAYS